MQHGKGHASSSCIGILQVLFRHDALVLCSEFGTSLTGILAGIWPCGIITLLDEVFVAESISQVYGSVHSLLHSNP